VNAVRIRGPRALFAGILGTPGLSLEGGSAGDDGDTHFLAAYATDDAIAAIRAAGLTVDIDATLAQQRTLLAQIRQQEGSDVTDIDIA
jgi:hypothetical protein